MSDNLEKLDLRVLGANGDAVESIDPLAMSDFVVREVPWREKRLLFHEPLKLTPELTASRQHVTLKDDALHIHVIAPTREDLQAELHEQIGVLWSEYALEADEKLSDAARALKMRLRSALYEEHEGIPQDQGPI